jgi:aspartyl-tRNA(Asn)/glutamyl-tRNA(Gln) amidotransferase subunit B
MQYEPIIGMEVHAQLATESKIFCGCPTTFGEPPNTQVCPICLGLPGVLPVLNRQAVDYTIMVALALGCRIATRSIFARKNYFYPDLPKGYQITMYELPLAEEGSLSVDGTTVSIQRVILEEEAAKSIHDTESGTLIDYNRSGIPLVEIVTGPDIRSPQQAVSYLTKVRQMLRYTGVSDADMEKGQFRCEPNLSLRPRGTETFGTRVELKNLNSLRAVEQGLMYEIERQTRLLSAGGTVEQQTMLWDEQCNVSKPMRAKETSEDYRYFPEPDLMPLVIEEDRIEHLRNSLPELPDKKLKRFIEQYRLRPKDAEVLTLTAALADYFESVTLTTGNPMLTSRWIQREVLAALKERSWEIDDFPIEPERFAELLRLIDNGTINEITAKAVLREMLEEGGSAQEIVSRRELAQISGEDALADIIDQVLSENPDELFRYRAGEEKLLQFFVGQVMKATRGKANPKVVNQVLLERLKGS